MPLDFSRIGTTSSVDTLTNPRELFAALPAKTARYGYLRDVQAEVLEQWFARRPSRDLRLKMNTGGGKTLVGLLILKSCLNELVSPAVYIAPTPYLASQVVQEARALGLTVDEDPRSLAVARGRAILVTTCHVLLNGKSKFGVGQQAIPIGSLVLDDAHACLATAEQQFTLTLDSSLPPYEQLVKLFYADLEAYSPTRAMDIATREPYKYMQVPFWAWHDKLVQVGAILHEHRGDNKLEFVWPLIQDFLALSRCVIGGDRLEIAPRCLPIDIIPSFARAVRRIFMSATFADDSVLITDFDVNACDIATAIAPSRASDLGDRMILVPQELDPQITDNDIRDAVVRKSQSVNAVVIVPSHRRAEAWTKHAAITITADSLEAGVAQLKAGHVGLAVIVNKYDGIDLPYDACRILVLDDIPDARRLIDRIEQSRLHGTTIEVGRSIQQIEQGMGRGVRASDDYCVVLLMGRSITGQLFTQNGLERLTQATKVQFHLSEEVGSQVRNQGMSTIESAMEYCLTRDAQWVSAAKAALVHTTYLTSSSDLGIAIARRRAFNLAIQNDRVGAVAVLQAESNAANDPLVKGWLMAELAEYTYAFNPVESHQILRAAHGHNKEVTRPLNGIVYQRLSSLTREQASNCIQHVTQHFKTANEVVIAAHSVASDLEFRPNSFRRFERAFRDAAAFLGFASQLPELENGVGPDVLWAVGGLQYFVIEAKNEATTATISKDYVNQLGGSINWFSQTYDATCSAVPILVHPASTVETAASPPNGTKVMSAVTLPLFRRAFLDFCTAISKLPRFGDTKTVADLLAVYKLLPASILATYTVPFDK